MSNVTSFTLSLTTTKYKSLLCFRDVLLTAGEYFHYDDHHHPWVPYLLLCLLSKGRQENKKSQL